jgi:hypothetical protein
LAVVGLLWVLLGFVGLHLPALALISLRWLSWAYIGHHWPDKMLNISYKSLAKKEKTTIKTYLGPNFDVSLLFGPIHVIVGLHWLLLAFVGLLWPALAIVSLCWLSFGPALVFVGLC